MTYNHASFITDAMDGFVMQKTDFPFVALIFDDASTDGTQDVIMDYLDSHFDKSSFRHEENCDATILFAIHKDNSNCHFVVILLKYNFYKIKKGKSYLVKEWYGRSTYRALCEGDDFWIDTRKLQKQVSYLDQHPECTMVCHGIKALSVKQGRYIYEHHCYKQDQDILIKDVVYKGGLFIPTCSLVFRREVYKDYPDYCRFCNVGDYPLQIMCTLKGKVYYYNDLFAVYRVENKGSWTNRQENRSISQTRLNAVKSIVEMLKGFSIDYSQYAVIFNDKIADYINDNIPKWNNSKEVMNYYSSFFVDEINNYSWFWILDYHIRKLRVPLIRPIYKRLFLRGFKMNVKSKCRE